MFNDGTTAESSDTNVYTRLVEQNGMWLIEADQQTPTTAAQATPGAVTPPAPQTPLPAIAVGQNTWARPGWALVA